MRATVALGYTLIGLQLVCAAIVSSLLRYEPSGFVGAKLFFVILLSAAHLGLWLWMLVDMRSEGFKELPVMMTVTLVMTGGLGALLYFFLVRLSRPKDDSGPPQIGV